MYNSRCVVLGVYRRRAYGELCSRWLTATSLYGFSIYHLLYVIQNKRQQVWTKRKAEILIVENCELLQMHHI